ncbi:MAG TPA: hypothetical protein VE967_18135 [Gemmatimonadaceae bacterium]|nr:hypothetical protein [Gemmatimonadaceae bacterium]
MQLSRPSRVARVAMLALAAAIAAPLHAQHPLLDAIRFREIGPSRQGGRFIEFAVLESKPQVFYAASATGGVFKTENNGISFEDVFQNQGIASVGAVALSQSNPDIVFVGSGEGNNSRSTYYGNGVYKSTDAGKTWKNVGLEKTNHIGRIVIHPTNPNIVFVAALGNLYSENPDRGLYRSLDGGTTWTKVLDHKVDGRSIGVIDVVMDPTNPQVLYASTYDKVRRPWSFAEGGPGGGLWKSVDGGTKWTMLAGGLPTGMLGRIGISIARSDPKTVYAVLENVNSRTGMTLEARKACLALGFGDGSIGDQLYRSDDAGKTWTQVAPNANAAAAPQVEEGTIGVAPTASGCGASGGRGGRGAAAAGADSAGRGGAGAAGRGAGGGAGGRAAGAGGAGAGGRGGAAGGRGAGGRGAAGDSTIAATVGRAGGGGGRGVSFGANPPYYYGQIRVDPKDKNHVYLLSVEVQHTQDGGATWTSPFGFGGDNHALWIDPKDSQHMILGFDHGMGVTFDGGRNWLHPDHLPLAQFYAITYDNARPYNVYGGIQDNGSIKGPSSTRGGNISYEDWYRTGGGDGMYSAVDWKEGRWLYNESQFGAIQRLDQWTGETKNIRYNGQGLRWNWASPILVSPHNPDVVYHASNKLLRSPFRGESWQEISPDLTVNDPAHAGGTGNVQYATISTIDESTIIPGLIWVGTDDGNVQVTRNTGATWTNVRDKITGDPGYWVSRVEAGHHDPAVAYVSVTGLRNDDFKPYLWKTTDYGATWTSITGNLPNESVNVIREDRRNPNLLFVGTDLGLYASLDGGKSWGKLKTGFPTNPVHDLQIQPRERELIVASHGRGAFIADISPLEELTPQTMSADAALFSIVPTVQWVQSPRPVTASINFAGQSRPAGVAINYWLKNAAQSVTVQVYDGTRVIAETPGPTAAGLQTVRWNMQASRPQTEAERAAAGRGGRGGGGGGGGFGGRGGGGRGGVVFPAAAQGTVLTNVEPGEYRVVLKVGSTDYTRMATVLEDLWYR